MFNGDEEERCILCSCSVLCSGKSVELTGNADGTAEPQRLFLLPGGDGSSCTAL